MIREDGVLWFNPGSVFMGRGVSRKSIGILRINEEIDAEIVNI
jgi:predicted phosphodiesterase